jgi:hypothetical protein
MKNKVYRQGDVLITPINEIPSGLKRTNKVTLAFGEVTGHHHTIYDSGCVGYANEIEGLAAYLDVESDCNLTHQEHDTITIPPGKYKVTRQVEYTPAALKNVAD